MSRIYVPFVLALAALSAACGLGTKHPPVQLQDVAMVLSGGERPASQQEAARVLEMLPHSENRALSELARDEYALVRKENRIVSWTLEDRRTRIPNHCPTICGCIAAEISGRIVRDHPAYKVYVISVHGRFGVNAFIGEQRSPVFYTHHVVTVVQDDQGAWSVIDPLIFGGDAGARPFGEWWTHLDPVDTYKFVVREMSVREKP